MRLDGAVALVTGAGSGIGRALALALAARGAHPVLVGRRVEALEQTAALCGRAATILRADLACDGQRQDLARQVEAVCGRLDLLVNNAGVVTAGPLLEQTDADWRHLLEVNLLAPMSLTRLLVPILARSGQGRVVNIGSMFGDIAFPYFAAYGAAKFGLRGWSDGLRREMAGHGIAVTYCAPRGTRTPAAAGFSAYADAFAMALDPPDRVAAAIVAGVARDARSIYPAGAERWFVLAQRLMPGLIDRALLRQRRAAVARGLAEPATGA